jgi:hypothetical protein
MSNPLDSVEGWGASAALTGIVLVPVLALFGLSLKGVVHRSEPARLGYPFLRAALPVFAL